jgi:hypothetical protein
MKFYQLLLLFLLYVTDESLLKIDANHVRESVKGAQPTFNFRYEYRSLHNVQPYITFPTSMFIKYPTSLC